jgi:hypothetical protein
VSPFQESETFPRGRRLVLIPVALVFLLGPYGSMLQGGPHDPLRWVVAMVSIALCAALIGLGLAPPRRTVVIDGKRRTILVSSTPPPPYFAQRHESRTFDDVDRLSIEEIGDRGTDRHGYCVLIHFHGGPSLELRLHENSDFAQDTIDHLVLLGLPGDSRADARQALIGAEKPTTWL